MSRVESRFNAAMLGIYEQAKKECDYTATYFLRMVRERGGLETAKILLAKSPPSTGYTTLWECGRLDLTVEALVLKAEFASLFSEEEKQIARKRLKDYGYQFKEA